MAGVYGGGGGDGREGWEEWEGGMGGMGGRDGRNGRGGRGDDEVWTISCFALCQYKYVYVLSFSKAAALRVLLFPDEKNV